MILGAMERARRATVSSIRKSSTNSCRPTSIGMTAGGSTRYGGVTGSSGRLRRRGGHGIGQPDAVVERRAGLAVRDRQEIPPAQRRRDRARTSKPEEFWRFTRE